MTPQFITRLRKRLGHDLLLLPGVCGLVFDEYNRILLNRRRDTGRWAVLGGIMEPGETPAAAVIREVREETGVRIEPLRITGVYSTPIITHPNGDRAQYVVTTFACRPIEGLPCCNDDESLEVRYFALDELPELSEHHRLRIEHATDVAAWFERV